WKEWEGTPNGWVCRGDGWQVVVNRSEGIDAAEIPVEGLKIHPGLAHRTEINIEGRQDGESAFVGTLTAQKLAKEQAGVVVDWQLEALVVPLQPRKRRPRRRRLRGSGTAPTA